MDEYIAEFVSESREMLQALERELVAWERAPADTARLDAIFRFVHTIKGNCGFFDMPRLQALAHAAEDVLAEVRAAKRSPDSQLVDAVLAVIDRIAEMIETIEAGGDIGKGDDRDLIAALRGEAVAVEAEPGPSAPNEGSSARPAESLRTVRLPTNLVDRFMSGISDMILVRNELERQIRELGHNAAIEATFNRLSTILADTQSAMTRVRMQPIGTLFSSYQRPIRDLAGELDKQVEVEIESGEVEIDREMIELLRDPLLHILRNAIDHGIEPPAQRTAAGKAAAGTLRLTARQTGNEIRIAISDDGRGIDGDALVERAVARGIISADQADRLNARQRAQLICEPGLSTAREVTNVSGRGVGMDVVRASVERIGGKLEIETTAGSGSRFVLDVPLTLSIVPSIMVRAGTQIFALPRSYVSEIVRGGPEVEAERIGGIRHVNVREVLHTCIGLGEVLGIAGGHDPLQQILVMVRMIDGSVFALGVDEIVDSGDLVIRPVAASVIRTGLYVGVAQLSDGRPALMLDIAGIARDAGLVGEVQGRSRLEQDDEGNAAMRAALPVIAFAARDGARKAVPMSAAERLADITADQIAMGDGTPSVVLDGEIVPLLGLDRLPDPDESIDILVLDGGEGRLAFATAGKVDAGDIDMATISEQTGRKLALLDGQAIELLDLARLRCTLGEEPAHSRRPTCRLPNDSWSREFLRPMVHAAGYEVVEDGVGPVDLEIVLEQEGHRPEAGSAASDVLLISERPGSGRGKRRAIHREDSVALAEALRSSARGRR